jgi:hypothetical protein
MTQNGFAFAGILLRTGLVFVLSKNAQFRLQFMLVEV